MSVCAIVRYLMLFVAARKRREKIRHLRMDRRLRATEDRCRKTRDIVTSWRERCENTKRRACSWLRNFRHRVFSKAMRITKTWSRCAVHMFGRQRVFWDCLQSQEYRSAVVRYEQRARTRSTIVSYWTIFAKRQREVKRKAYFRWLCLVRWKMPRVRLLLEYRCLLFLAQTVAVFSHVVQTGSLVPTSFVVPTVLQSLQAYALDEGKKKRKMWTKGASFFSTLEKILFWRETTGERVVALCEELRLATKPDALSSFPAMLYSFIQGSSRHRKLLPCCEFLAQVHACVCRLLVSMKRVLPWDSAFHLSLVPTNEWRKPSELQTACWHRSSKMPHFISQVPLYLQYSAIMAWLKVTVKDDETRTFDPWKMICDWQAGSSEPGTANIRLRLEYLPSKPLKKPRIKLQSL